MINYLITHQRHTRCLKSGAWVCAVVEDRGCCYCSALLWPCTHKHEHTRLTRTQSMHTNSISIDSSLALFVENASDTRPYVEQAAKQLSESRTHWLVGHWKHREIIKNDPDTHKQWESVPVWGRIIPQTALLGWAMFAWEKYMRTE